MFLIFVLMVSFYSTFNNFLNIKLKTNDVRIYIPIQPNPVLSPIFGMLNPKFNITFESEKYFLIQANTKITGRNVIIIGLNECFICSIDNSRERLFNSINFSLLPLFALSSSLILFISSLDAFITV